MSISFSGLASGLDTTSWVESLVALKRAKVTTLQEEKEELLVSKDTLSSIKNFFNSFRSTIERITDSRFNIVSMDLFAQNIATSANLSVLTATASSEAEEGSYKVKVDKLASSTTATSNYKKTTTTTVTATATEDTLLTNIGVKTGNIGVTVNGIKHGIAITEKDTIGTFIDKLENIGVEASFNKNTGVFSMNISAGDIDDDIDNDGNNDTEIVEKLHLAGVNEGYKTQNKLEVEKVETVWEEADKTTKLVDLGVNAGTITITANDSLYDVTIDDTTTIEEFVQALNTNNINATYDETTGIFTLNDAEITNEGSTNIISAFGLQSSVYSKSQVSKDLSLQTIITTTTTADATTKLIEIGNVSDGDTVIVKNSSNEYTTITVGTETKIEDLLAEISNAGLYATINNDGTVEITGGVIEGGTFDAINALGLSTQPFTAMTTGNPLTETTIEYKIVDLQTRLVEDLGVTKGYLEVTDADGNKFYEKIYSGQTIADFMADMGNLGIYTKLDEETGVLEITGGAFRTLDNLSDEVGSLISNGTIAENDDAYKRGTNLLECLYGADVISTEQISVSSTYSRSRALTTSVTNLLNADLNTTLELLGLTTEGTAIFDSHGSEVTIDITKDLTIQALREKLSDNGISTEWDALNSKLTINNATLVGGTSDLGDILNLTEVISGKYVNSDAIYTTTYQTIFAEPSTLLTELGLKIEDNIVYTSYTIDGTITESGVTGTVIGISSATDLQNLANLVNAGNTMSGKTFVLTNDIDLSTLTNFEGIGTFDDYFGGTFDGQGHTISNLNINKTFDTHNCAGLFNFAMYATIKNFTLKDAYFDITNTTPSTAAIRIGGVIGSSWLNHIENINVDNITIITNNDSNSSVGGIYGYGGSGAIINCKTNGTIQGTHAGGIAGWIYTNPSAPTTIDNCQNNARVTSRGNNAGGIVGLIDMSGEATITNCYNRGTVYSTGRYSAGIIGAIYNRENSTSTISISNCYNNGAIPGYYNKVNIVNFGIFNSNGSTSSSVNITNCFGASSAITKTTSTAKAFDNTTQWSSISISTTNCENELTDEQVCEKAIAAGWDTNKWALTPTNINLKMASEEVILYKEDGTSYTLNVDETTTLQNLIDQINYYGVTASISGGKFEIENGYISNETIENILGLKTTISGESVVLGTQLTHTITEGATGESTLGEIIETLGTTAESKVAGGYELSFKGTTLTVDENTTLNNLFEQISIAGGRAFLDSTGRIHIEGGTLTGSVAEALGFTTQNITTAVSATGESITMIATVVADYTSRVGDFTDYTTTYNIDGEITVDGVTGTIIGISSAEELALLATHVNNGSSMAGKTFVLTDDIDLSDYENWTPIGNSDYNNCWFTGTFDGNGHTISNLNQEAHQDPSAADNNYIGLFGVAVNATIKNLKLDNVNIEDNDIANYISAGALLGIGSNITLENIEVNNLNMQLTSSNGYMGGVAGRILNDSHFNNIKADGTIVQTGSASAVGGLFGELYNISGTVQYCYSSVDITANSGYAGGIAAGLITNNTLAAQYCLNNGTIHNNNWHTGGIFGLLNNTTTTTNVESCYNLGSLSSADATAIADIFTRCGTTTGTINVNNCGGIYGEAYKATHGTTINVTGFVTNYSDIMSATSSAPEHWDVSSGVPIPSVADIYIKNSSGDIAKRINNIEDMTFEELFNELNSYGINASFENGIITMTSADGNYITGPVAEALGITTTSTTETVTIGITNTSSVAITYTEEKFIDYNSRIGDSLNNYVIDGVITENSVSGTVIAISTAQELEWLANQVNSGNRMNGKTFVLTDDIDLSDYSNWDPIGNKADRYMFSGTFDGNGHTISNLTQTQLATDQYNNGFGGLFGFSQNATFKNIKLDNVRIEDTDGSNEYYYLGALLGYGTNVTIENIDVTNLDINLNSNDKLTYVAGVVSVLKKSNNSSEGSFTNVKASGSINVTGSNNSIGGLVAHVDTYDTLSYLHSDVNITAETCNYVGGVIASFDRVQSSLALEYCTNNGNITVQSANGKGGISGYISNVTTSYSINNCSNYGWIEGSHIGEIIGYKADAKNLTLTNCGVGDFGNEIVGNSAGGTITDSGTTLVTQATTHITPADIFIHNSSGEIVSQIGNVSNMTYQELFDELNLHNINAQINNGVISLTSADGNYITGPVAEALGIEVVETTATVTGGKTFQSTMAVTYTETSVVDTTTTLEDLKHMSEAQAVAQGYTWVTTAEELRNALSSSTTAKVMLGCDISLADITDWTPIGTDVNPFMGELNGNGYCIEDLNTSQGGFFGYLDGAVIQNITFDNAYVNSTGQNNSGVIAQDANNSTFYNCNIINSGIVSEEFYSGAFIGFGKNCTIENCNSAWNEIISYGFDQGSKAGGFAGSLEDSTIKNSYTYSNVVISGCDAGGIAGIIEDCQIENCNIQSSQVLGDYFSGIFAGSVNGNYTFTNIIYDDSSTELIDFVGYDSDSSYFINVREGTVYYNDPPESINIFNKNNELIDVVNLYDYDENHNPNIGHLISCLSEYGISASVNNGIISLTSTNGNYITGGIADLLGIGTQEVTVTKTVGTTATSTASIIYTEEVVADYNSKVSEYLNRYEFDGKITESGITGNVIAISTAEDLALLATHVNNGSSTEGKTFVLTNDIDLSAYENWTPIGAEDDNKFKGTFDGNGYTIYNLSQQVYTTETDFEISGLFGFTSSATFKNIKMHNVNIVDSRTLQDCATIASLVGDGYNTNFENIEVTGLNIQVSAPAATIGGVIGYSTKSKLYNIKIEGNINNTESSDCVGGIAGFMWSASETLEYLYSDVNIDLSNISFHIGGIVGNLNSENSTIAQYCANIGNISSTNCTGGLFGYLDIRKENPNAINNCYNIGTLTGAENYYGDIIGYSNALEGNLTIRDCGGITGNQYGSSYGTVITEGNYATGTEEEIISSICDQQNWDITTGIPQPADIIIKNANDGSIIDSFNIGDITFQELFEELSNYGINCTMNNGQISVENTGNNYATGRIWEALGFEEIITTTTVTTTTPIQVTSTAAVTYTSTSLASSTDTLGSLKYAINGSITADGVTGTVIGISSAEELQYLANQVNSGNSMSGKTFVLTNDIDLSGISNWVSIGIFDGLGTSYAFMGNFDGQGYTISNLTQNRTITAEDTTLATGGLFGYVDSYDFSKRPTIKNLTLNDFVITSTNEDSSNQSAKIGGLIGYAANAKVSGITLENISITAGDNSFAGGIIGQATYINITDCTTSSGNISSSTYAGGILAYAACWDGADISINNCQNNFTVISTNSAAGGIVGRILASDKVNITNTLNKGDIKGYNYVGGIVGRLSNNDSSKITATIDNSINIGKIEATTTSSKVKSSIINLLGATTLTSTATISNCYGYSTATTDTTELIQTFDNWTVSGVTTESGCFNDLDSSSIQTHTASSNYDSSIWSIGTFIADINLKTGDEYDIFVSDSSSGLLVEKIDLNAGNTIQEVSQQLMNYGSVLFENDVISYSLNSAFTISGAGTSVLNTTLKVTNTETMTSDTTLAELGVTNFTGIRLKKSSNNELINITVTEEQTISDFMIRLSSYGFDCYVDSGKLTINSINGEYYISSNVGLIKKLNMDTNLYSVTSSTTTTYTSSTESDRLIADIGRYMNSDTTFKDLGCLDGSSSTMTVYSDGEFHIISITSSKTLDEFMTELASYGITTEISEDGKFTFKADNNEYIVSMDTELQNYLKLNNEFNTTQDSTKYANTTLNHTIQIETTKTLKSSTTFSDLGITDSKELEVISNGNVYTITINPDQTIGDLMTTLAGYGIVCSINEGKLVLQGNGENFISSIDTDLSNILQIEEIVYPDIITTTYTNTTSDEFKTTSYIKATSSTTIGLLRGDDTWSKQTIELKSNGIEYIITVSDSHTIGDILTSLAGFGISGTINDGKLTLTGDKESHIIRISTELQNALGLNGPYSNTTVITTTTNDDSNKLSATTTTTATGATKLEDLRDKNGHSPADYQINLTTESQEGSFNTVLTFNTTNTLHDVIDKLAEYGINATIDSTGRFATNSNTLTDFDISGGLGEFLMSDSYIKIYQESSVNNTSTILPAQTEELMNDSTQLAELDITSGDIVVYKNGEKFIINIDENQTVGDFRTQLGEYGISSSIIEGKLQLISNGVVYLETPDTNASNLVEVMELGQINWSKGDYSQESDSLNVVKTINVTATLDSKITDLTDVNGNPLGITNGQIYVSKDGVNSIIDINTNDTLRTLADKLKNYGITVGISQDGHLYFDANDNSYLTTEGLLEEVASNILTKLNISGDWNTRHDSVSEKLDYETDGESVADGSTKLVDLQDEAGNNLGITTGTYYVYQNGVRNTETITSDTTVNDFRATMATYGLTTDFNENGELSVGGYNETYLATSALASENTNAIDVLFEQWNFVNVYTSNGLDIPENVTVGISETTKLADINEGTYQAGYITVVKDGVKTNIQLTENDTVGDLIDELALYGFESVINSNGQLIIKNTGNSTLEAYSGGEQASNALGLLGIENWINTNTYISTIKTITTDVSATRETLLSDLGLGITTGEYYIYNNGVKYTALISSDETVGSLMDTLASFGIQTNLVNNGTSSVISIIGNGDSYVATSNSATNASNVVQKLFIAGNSTSYNYTSNAQLLEGSVTSTVTATETTLLSVYDDIANNKKAEGDLVINIDGYDNIVQITADDTLGSLVSKLQGIGLNAMLADGNIIIESGYKEITITSATTSDLLDTINLRFENDLGGYVSSNTTVIDTQTIIEDKTLSVANYADYGTEMKLLNISSGSLTVYRNGEKATIQVDENQTFGNLNTLISARFADVKLGFEDGYLRIYSDSVDVSVEVGSTTDTSNFSAITGITSDGNGDTKSSRELYCVNSNSVITTSGLFRNGNVTEGTFKIGDATFEITSATRLSDLISQINASQDANATAYWDSIDGKFVIQSRTTGAALINIEADSSNFTDIMGLTTSGMEDTDGDGTDDDFVTRINTNTQKIGDNAKFSINGTYYTSTKNEIGSDVSRINGLTINLKGISEGETTITVERDKETVANAVSDVVDAYNELIENIDKEIAKGKPLADQSTLKLIRNQIRSVMTGALVGASTFKNLDAIGISIEKAAANNINTANINVLNFDKDKFIKAFDADRDALKTLLVGTESNNGIFQQVENIIEQAVTTGYFTSAERSYNNQISRLDSKIEKAQKAVERYKEQLEAKFASMDLLISKMQNQYSSFLGV